MVIVDEIGPGIPTPDIELWHAAAAAVFGIATRVCWVLGVADWMWRRHRVHDAVRDEVIERYGADVDLDSVPYVDHDGNIRRHRSDRFGRRSH